MTRHVCPILLHFCHWAYELVEDNKLIHLKVINVNIKQFCYVLQTLASIEQF